MKYRSLLRRKGVSTLRKKFTLLNHAQNMQIIAKHFLRKQTIWNTTFSIYIYIDIAKFESLRSFVPYIFVDKAIMNEDKRYLNCNAVFIFLSFAPKLLAFAKENLFFHFKYKDKLIIFIKLRMNLKSLST